MREEASSRAVVREEEEAVEGEGVLVEEEEDEDEDGDMDVCCSKGEESEVRIVSLS